MVPRVARGFHCSMSLRACTITLACIQMGVSLFHLAFSVGLEYAVSHHPKEALHEDFDIDYPDYILGHNYFSEETTEAAEPTAPEPAALHDAPDFDSGYSTFLIVTEVFELVNSIFCLLDVILSCILIAGAVHRRAALVRPWLFIGAAIITYDILYFVVHTAMGIHFMYSITCLLHIPLAAYLWVVTWSLYLDCSEEAKRNASSLVSMSALVEDGNEDVDAQCSVPYSTLGK